MTKESKSLDSKLMQNFRIAIDYLAVNVVLLAISGYILKNYFPAIIIPIIISLVIAYYSKIIAIRRPYAIHNYYPFWFYACAITLITMLITEPLVQSNLIFNFLIVFTFVIHIALGIYAMGLSDQMVDED